MKVFYEAIKWVFFFLSIVVGLFFLRGDIFFWDQTFNLVKQIIMPGYLLFCGIMVGYVIANIKEPKANTLWFNENSALVKTFLIGIGIWVFLAILYILS